MRSARSAILLILFKILVFLFAVPLELFGYKYYYMIAGRCGAQFYSHASALTHYFGLIETHIRIVGLYNAVAVDARALERVLDSLRGMVKEGLAGKVSGMHDETKAKMRRAITRIINEGKGGVICILLNLSCIKRFCAAHNNKKSSGGFLWAKRKTK